MKKLGLELGGNAPFVVFDDADIDAAVEGAMVSKYRNMGQTCVCANRLYAQDKIYDAFVEKLEESRGDEDRRRHRAGVDAGPADQHGGGRQGREAHRRRGQAGRQARRPAASAMRSAAPSSSRPCSPTSTPDALVSREETFGPLAPVFRFKDEAEVIAMCQRLPVRARRRISTRAISAASGASPKRWSPAWSASTPG